MAMERTYLDYNASAPLLPDARNAMLAALDTSANPSSIHSDGRKSRASIERARINVADLVGAKADQVVFTNGATEAAQLVLSPILNAPAGEVKLDHLYVSAIEHPCILNGGRFDEGQRTIVPVTTEGVLDLELFGEILSNRRSDAPFLMALMLANNETGIIQPVTEASKLVHEAGGYLLVDAVQAVGRIPINISDLGADFLILSSHKIGGPQGVGALVLGDKNIKPRPLVQGGGQEFQLRAGTENVAGIVGFGAASILCIDQLDHMREIVYVRDKFEEQLKTVLEPLGNRFGPLLIIGEGVERLANTTCFAIAGINAETALISLDLDGISVSSGSACSSGRVETSHVLMAMGLDKDVANAAIRVSLGWNSTAADTKNFLEAWSSYLKRLTYL
jgi:cysteine desulfurase